MFFNTSKLSYDVIKGPNGSIVLDIAVPGLRKQDLEVRLENGVLNVKTVCEFPEAEYIRQGIYSDINGNWRMPEGSKVDMVTLDNGILRILISDDIRVNSSNILEIT